jgi:hypothetical protein
MAPYTSILCTTALFELCQTQVRKQCQIYFKSTTGQLKNAEYLNANQNKAISLRTKTILGAERDQVHRQQITKNCYTGINNIRTVGRAAVTAITKYLISRTPANKTSAPLRIILIQGFRSKYFKVECA